MGKLHFRLQIGSVVSGASQGCRTVLVDRLEAVQWSIPCPSSSSARTCRDHFLLESPEGDHGFRLELASLPRSMYVLSKGLALFSQIRGRQCKSGMGPAGPAKEHI